MVENASEKGDYLLYPLYVYFKHSASTWSASSRVGARTNIPGPPRSSLGLQ